MGSDETVPMQLVLGWTGALTALCFSPVLILMVRFMIVHQILVFIAIYLFIIIAISFTLPSSQLDCLLVSLDCVQLG